MDNELLRISFLAAVQGITEFLPISSSGHLILPAVLWGWPDQGLVFDVAVHVGSLLAVLLYFRQQLCKLTVAWVVSLRSRKATTESVLAWLLLIATIPAGLAGLLFNDLVDSYARAIPVIATTSIVFALLLLVADRRKANPRSLKDLTWKSALFIGAAQALAIIPGTSRSGITMTAGLFLNLSRQASAQFSILLSIPIIAVSGGMKGLEHFNSGASQSEWLVLLYGSLVAGLVSYLCIHYFLKLIERIGFLPFVVYRVVLGSLLFIIYLG